MLSKGNKMLEVLKYNTTYTTYDEHEGTRVFLLCMKNS